MRSDGLLAPLIVRAAPARSRTDLVEPTFLDGFGMEVANSGPKTGPERTVQTAMAASQRRFIEHSSNARAMQPLQGKRRATRTPRSVLPQ
jgi:hypothetical protein